MSELDVARFQDWIGRSERAGASVTPWLVAAFRATFDLPDGDLSTGAAAPQALHWCIGTPTAPTAGLGPDGHPARGGFLPPVPLPRRMWAGGRLVFHDDLRVGDETERVSTVKRIEAKEGRTGPLVFVLVEHRLSTQRGLCVVEEHDIVYRGVEAPAVRPSGQAKGDEAADLRRLVEPSAALLFRYSALTFNGHRIHYDRRYCIEEENYPGLIVHGPLQASLMIGLGRELAGGALRRFSFRAVKPLFDLAPFSVAGRREGQALELWCADAAGERTMIAQAE